MTLPRFRVDKKFSQKAHYPYRMLTSGAVLEGFLRFPDTSQVLSLDDGYAPFQLQSFTSKG